MYKIIIRNISSFRSSIRKVSEIPPHGGYETVLCTEGWILVISDFL